MEDGPPEKSPQETVRKSGTPFVNMPLLGAVWGRATNPLRAAQDQNQTYFHFPSTIHSYYSPTWFNGLMVVPSKLYNFLPPYLYSFVGNLLGSHLEMMSSFSSIFHNSLKQSFIYILKRGVLMNGCGISTNCCPLWFREQYLWTLPSYYLNWVLFICHIQ